MWCMEGNYLHFSWHVLLSPECLAFQLLILFAVVFLDLIVAMTVLLTLVIVPNLGHLTQKVG